MYYKKISLDILQKSFDLKITEASGIYCKLLKVYPSSLFTEVLQDNIPLAIAIGKE